MDPVVKRPNKTTETMKIIKEGLVLDEAKPAPPWWAGMQIMCPRCGSQLELEAGDRINMLDLDAGRHLADVLCPVCHQPSKHSLNVKPAGDTTPPNPKPEPGEEPPAETPS
jgi:hypothetical protein